MIRRHVLPLMAELEEGEYQDADAVRHWLVRGLMPRLTRPGSAVIAVRQVLAGHLCVIVVMHLARSTGGCRNMLLLL